MIRSILFRLILLVILVGIASSLYFWPLITIAILYPVSWLLMWPDITPVRYKLVEEGGFVGKTGLFKNYKRIRTYEWNISNFVAAPIALIYIIFLFMIIGGAPPL